MPNLKNYTTSVPATRSITEIENILISFGATHIMKEYHADGRIKSLAFKYNNKGFLLPANDEGVYEFLFKGKRTNYRQDGEKGRRDKAYRIAWRVIKDWVHSQLTIIQTGQALPEQVLLPYMYDGNETLYEKIKKSNFALLEERGDAE